MKDFINYEKGGLNYKGFTIIKDRLLGFSLIDRHGNWACSKGNIDYLKNIVNDIIKTDKPIKQIRWN